MADPATHATMKNLRLLIALVSMSSISSTTARFAVLVSAAQAGASPATVGLIASLFPGVGVLISVPIGKMLDRMGVKQPLLWSSAMLAASVALGAFWRGLPMLVAIVVFSGIAFNMMVISFSRLAGDLAPPDRRAEAFGMLGFGYSISLLSAPIIAGFSIDLVGFAWSFALFALIPMGSLYMVWNDKLPFSAPVAGTAATHDATETRSGTMAMLRSPALRHLWVCCTAFEAGWMGFTFMLPIVGTQLGFSASKIGLIAGTAGFTLFLTRGILTQLLRWMTPWQLLITGLALGGIGFTGFIFATEFAWMAGFALFIGFGQGACSPMLTALVYENAPAHEKGQAMAMRTMTSNISQFSTPLVAGILSAALGATAVFVALAAFMGGVSWSSRKRWKLRRQH